MADAITVRKDGFHEMAAAEGVAIWWERDGRKAQRLDGTEDTDGIVRKAGLDWEYVSQPVRYVTVRDGQRMYAKFDGRVILVRSDNDIGLSDVSTRFKVRQPREMVEFFEELIRKAGFKMNSVGSLHGGLKVWAQADVADGTIVPGDVQKTRLLIADACDGSMMTTAKFVNESVVCANTLAIGLGETGHQVRVSHRSVFDPAEVKRRLGVAVGAFDVFMRDAREMAKRPMSPDDVSLFLSQLLGAHSVVTTAKQAEENAKILNGWKFSTMADSMLNAPGQTLSSRKNTLWGVVNAVTHAVDHKARAASSDNRVDSALFGAGADLKSAAWDRAMAVLAEA